jgi:hypothetical protein
MEKGKNKDVGIEKSGIERRDYKKNPKNSMRENRKRVRCTINEPEKEQKQSKGNNWIQFKIVKRVSFMCDHNVQLHRSYPPFPSCQMALIEWGTMTQ